MDELADIAIPKLSIDDLAQQLIVWEAIVADYTKLLESTARNLDAVASSQRRAVAHLERLRDCVHELGEG